MEAGLAKSPSSATILPSEANFCAIVTAWRGFAWLSWMSTWTFRPPIPSALLTSLIARLKAFFQMAPYSALSPVIGPQTPNTTGPDDEPPPEEPEEENGFRQAFRASAPAPRAAPRSSPRRERLFT